jgi:hypothetical protein
MRTTLDIDDDVLLAAKERARRERKSAGEVISELARRALTDSGHPQGAAELAALYGFRPFVGGNAIVTNDLIDQLRDEDAY